jgi:hypothetical protein
VIVRELSDAVIMVPLPLLVNVGVVIVGDVVPTGPPVPLGVPVRSVATPVPSPLTPVEIGKPVQLVRVPALGVPSAPPLTTNAPALPTLTARAVATLVPSPLTPVEIGSPVQLVRVPLAGVPRIGVTKVGLVASTLLPVPVLVTLTRFLDASVATALEAVKLATLAFVPT